MNTPLHTYKIVTERNKKKEKTLDKTAIKRRYTTN